MARSAKPEQTKAKAATPPPPETLAPALAAFTGALLGAWLWKEINDDGPAKPPKATAPPPNAVPSAREASLQEALVAAQNEARRLRDERAAAWSRAQAARRGNGPRPQATAQARGAHGKAEPVRWVADPNTTPW